MSAASADATITYTVGPTAGNPIFDLRQSITQAWIDGTAFPIAQMAHHSFGTDTYTDLRVVQSIQAAGSVHTLRVQYALAAPDSQMGGSYLPAIEWSAGPKLRFVFGLSDLNRARYAEAWLPVNLIFDQYSIDLEISIINTAAAHSVITNGTATVLGVNHWSIVFPDHFTALSPLLEVRASDTLVSQNGSVVLPVSGKNVVIEAWKPVLSGVDLAAQINNVKNLLTQNENDYGAYMHDGRFTVFFNGTGGMEYEGGTTVSTGALAHETFHSWFARCVKPAGQADGWWDEGFTTFHDSGADDAVALDFTDPPVLLCSRDPWQRNTPSNSYSDGGNLWMGLASLLGVANLNTFMKQFYDTYKNDPVSTQMIEEFLLCRSGNARVVDTFHRFVYGFADPSLAPDLWIKDDPTDPGADAWAGAFWDSPDLWIRNSDDGGLTHQSPEYGQDNWFHARVHNKAGRGNASHFVVTFHARGWAGTEFVYPDDFLPCTAARGEFNLAPGETQIVKAKWPRAAVPHAGTHTCMLASVIARSDAPVAHRHVWEHNNLAQKNLTVVDLRPDMFIIVPVVIRNSYPEFGKKFDLEMWKPQSATEIHVSILHRSKEFFSQARVEVREFRLPKESGYPPDQLRLDCGGMMPGIQAASPRDIMTTDRPDLILRRFAKSWEVQMARGTKPKLACEIPPFSQIVIGVKVVVGPRMKPGETVKLHVVQRNCATKQVTGGIAVQVNVI
ncbi:MAG TPA: hypothetical protein VK327_14515 [Candidatus Paceibacterota bacterium]|nr:hypothetical protein [Candidatus Paceibacterota bacterium]